MLTQLISLSKPYRPGHPGSAGGFKITVPLDVLPLPLLWSGRQQAPVDSADRLHQAYHHAVWSSRSPLGHLHLGLMFLLWPLIMAGAIGVATCRSGRMVKRWTGKGILRQMAEQFMLGARFGFRPVNYYTFEFFLPERRAQAAQYIQRTETKEGLYRLLKVNFTSPLQDKLGFSNYCRARDLPVTPILAAFEQGRRSDGAVSPLPASDLFVKRTRGRGGVRAGLWRYAHGRYRDRDGRILDEKALLAEITQLSRREPFIIQRREVNHPATVDLSPTALATVRIVTVINEQGVGEPIRAAFRMGQAVDSIVDNFHAGGIASAVEMESGRLGPATDLGQYPSVGWLDHHPATGAAITGRMLPLWPELRELAARAHGHFGDRLVIGWDIALTPQGLVIVEGNAATDVDIIQRPHRAPLGGTRYAELIAWHLDRLFGPAEGN